MSQQHGDDIATKLPPYARSLLKIEVPVSVTLAARRQPISRVVELTPGAIIQFEKACDEMLDLEVGGCNVAEGEAVKVGDKFGLRVTSITLPEERFRALRKQQQRQAARQTADGGPQNGSRPNSVDAAETYSVSAGAADSESTDKATGSSVEATTVSPTETPSGKAGPESPEAKPNASDS